MSHRAARLPGESVEEYQARRRAAASAATPAPFSPIGAIADPRLDQEEKARKGRALLLLPRLVAEAGCGEAIPESERKGCGCTYRCLRGRSPRGDGGVTAADCWACPERPEIPGP